MNPRSKSLSFRLSGLLAAASGLVAIWLYFDPFPAPAVTSARLNASLAAPTGVTADPADRRLTVTWSPVEGATIYKIAARLTNGVESFAWNEYDTKSPPYAITDPWATMSGLEYEVRVAAVNDDGQSTWSPIIAVTAPALRLAPADSIRLYIKPHGNHGEMIWPRLEDQSSATNVSSWIWFVCDHDDSGCKLLPPTESSGIYFARKAARGERLKVQVAYDKDGSSWTAATAVSRVVRPAPPLLTPAPDRIFSPGCEEAAPSLAADAFATRTLATHLYHLESQSVSISWDNAFGGSIEPLCNDLLVVTPWGRIALVRPYGMVVYLPEGRVPMNLEGLKSHPGAAAFSPENFRVADILLKQVSEDHWELFVTHHYFAGKCVRFRLSSTTVLRQGASVSVSRSWKKIFDAEPCIPIPVVSIGALRMAGGRILTDGRDHLLVVIGSHKIPQQELAPDPDWHMGKLLRIAVETGEAKVLSVGLRNPQGFARDAEGNLWETEHGPRGGDELNLLEPGINYGWPHVSYGIGYGGKWLTEGRRLRRVSPESTGRHDGFSRPAFSWVPSIAVSAMIVNDERWFPLWKDDLLVASLGRSWHGNSIYRIRRDGTNVQYVERIKVGYRVRDLTRMPDGRLALLADHGHIHFLSVSSEYCNVQSRKLQSVYAMSCGPSGSRSALVAHSDYDAKLGRDAGTARHGDPIMAPWTE